MHKKINSLVALILLSVYVFSQNIDSLKYELKKAKHDTIRCKILNELTENASDEEWPEFNNQLLKITSKKIKLEKLPKAEYILYQKYYATAVLNLGVLANSFGELDTALLHYNNSLGFFLNLKDTEHIALCYNNIGSLYDNIDNNELNNLSYFNIQKYMNKHFFSSKIVQQNNIINEMELNA